MVLTNLDQAKALHAPVLSKDLKNNLAVAYVTPAQLEKLSLLNHLQGRCGGFELLSAEEANQPALVVQNLLNFQSRLALQFPLQSTQIEWSEEYQKLADQADPQSLRQTVQWISSYPSRNDGLSKPNEHVFELKNRLENGLQGAKWPFQIEMINHQSTQQKSLRLRIPGRTEPEKVVVLGAHFDSVNQSFFGGSRQAPGADDNASGSSNLIEALKVLKTSEQPNRTLEFYWYAGEESGLLGSAEIAKSARAEGRQVVGVLQLDMTLFPGSGEQVIGLISDFTSPWLREVLTKINSLYVKARFVDDRCGYACSDHAAAAISGQKSALDFHQLWTLRRTIFPSGNRANLSRSGP
jgi:leucyl aminopeptidase